MMSKTRNSSLRRVLALYGPTASGKSALALALAETAGGEVVNADSLQIYKELPVLTAQPGPEDQRRAPHRLYGVLAATDPCSAGRWRSLAADAIEAAGDRPVILTGGSGLYLSALLRGLSAIPPVPDAVRAAATERHAELGAEKFHAELARRDPVSAMRLRPSDRQRLIRAWEVLEATGRSLAFWQAAPRQTPPGHWRIRLAALLPPRAALYARIEQRLWDMVGAGALDELAAIRHLDPALPLCRAAGVPELRAALAGSLSLPQAIQAAAQTTRHYAKRQFCWARHQFTPDLVIEAAFTDDEREESVGSLQALLRQE